MMQQFQLNFQLLLSIIAIVISLFSLTWNIWNKIQDERKKMIIQCYKTKSNDKYKCVVTLTNIGKKPIYIRRIEIQEKVNNKIENKKPDYFEYQDKTENKPLYADDWRTIIISDHKYLSLYDADQKKYKTTRIIIVDSKGKEYYTKWFEQNNNH